MKKTDFRRQRIELEIFIWKQHVDYHLKSLFESDDENIRLKHKNMLRKLSRKIRALESMR